ncbi:AtpZ/AtpI family protein [Nitriliruptoraceae bacterium ZYF776]|nr:AtpZ/AtpI family protein [Profundirhabdus halotolerans]
MSSRASAPARPTDAELARGHERRHFRATLSGVDQANVMGVELVVGVLFWGGMGYLVDRWLGIVPVLSTVGVLLGMCVGLYLMHLRSLRMDEAEAARVAAARAARLAARAAGSERSGASHGA